MARFFDSTGIRPFHADSVNDAVTERLEILDPHEWPATVTAQAWENTDVGSRLDIDDARYIVEQVRDVWDANYADPDGDSGFAGREDKCHQLALDFLKELAKEYQAWSCVRVLAADVTVHTATWIREHAPQWLEREEVRTRVEELESGKDELHVFSCADCEWVIAHNLADAVEVFRERGGDVLDPRDELDQEPDDKNHAIWCDAKGVPSEPFAPGNTLVTKTHRDWCQLGRGYLCTTEI